VGVVVEGVVLTGKSGTEEGRRRVEFFSAAAAVLLF
jgi:hypothetical protein